MITPSSTSPASPVPPPAGSRWRTPAGPRTRSYSVETPGRLPPWRCGFVTLLAVRRQPQRGVQQSYSFTVWISYCPAPIVTVGAGLVEPVGVQAAVGEQRDRLQAQRFHHSRVSAPTHPRAT